MVVGGTRRARAASVAGDPTMTTSTGSPRQPVGGAQHPAEGARLALEPGATARRIDRARRSKSSSPVSSASRWSTSAPIEFADGVALSTRPRGRATVRSCSSEVSTKVPASASQKSRSAVVDEAAREQQRLGAPSAACAPSRPSATAR